MKDQSFDAPGSMFNGAWRFGSGSAHDVLQRWLTIGIGIGIEVRGPDLNVFVAKVRPRGAIIIGQLLIRAFDERPPSELKTEYKTFLRQLGVARTGAVLLLPRDDVCCRTIKLPGVKDGLVPSALNFEVDSYYPWRDEVPVWDWVRIRMSSSVLLVMTSRAVVQRYLTLFEQMDIKVSHFTCEPAALYASVHMFGHSRRGAFLVMGEDQGDQVVYGESDSMPLYSIRLQASFEKARSLAIGQLRASSDIGVIPLSEAVPATFISAPAGEPFSWSMAYAAALCARTPRFVRTLNLLPRQSGWRRLSHGYTPTFTLLMLVVLAMGVLISTSSMAETRYYSAISTAIERVQPQARESAELDRKIAILRRRAQTIDTFRMRSKDDLDALSELTQLITPPTWISSFSLTGRGLLVSGQSDQAAALLKIIDASTQFSGSDFSTPVTRDGKLDRFSIRAKRKPVNHDSF